VSEADAAASVSPVSISSNGAVSGKPRARAPHLYEIDIVRILTFAAVIAVHTTSHTIASGDLPLAIFLGLAHFTREVFFAITTFVLLYTYRYKPTPQRKALPRRFLLVGVPYVVWSTIYFVASNLHTPHATFGQSVINYFYHLATGSAWYHLYFLLVTMQVYLLIPAIIWLVRKTRGHHMLLLTAAFIVQVVLSALYMYWPNTVAAIVPYAKEYFFSYTFFIMLGAVAADHSPALLRWVREHRGLIALITLASAVITVGVFLVQMATGMSAYRAGTPMQPIIMFWSLAVALAFLAVGTWWADRRVPDSRFAKGVDVASDRSFGIFLAHPFFIWILLWIGNDWFLNTVPKPWLTLVIYILVVAGAWGVTEFARRTPLSLPLAGRPFRSRKPVR
jgi:peptidoglycan/LPS O-acetylase OafA/YrhL